MESVRAVNTIAYVCGAQSARELTHSRPLTWTDAAVAFFGYDPLAKVLYRKLGDQFDEHIT